MWVLYFLFAEMPLPKSGAGVKSFVASPTSDVASPAGGGADDGDAPASISGVVQSWQEDKGFGFVRRSEGRGQSLFCHRSDILDGNCLVPNAAVFFQMVANEKKPGQLKAARVSGGSCRAHLTGDCRKGAACRWSHAAVPNRAEAATAAAESALAELSICSTARPTVLADTLEACAEQCGRY